MVFFIQTVIIPFANGLGFIAIEPGSPAAWVFSGAGAVFSWIFIKMLLWNVKREATYV
jgi:hypothetical protein